MDFRDLRYELEDGVARITLDHPPRNTMDLTTARELLRAATRCDEDPEVRAVFITSLGSAFSIGGDVGEFSSDGEDLPVLLKELTTYLHAAISRLVRSRAPVIAAVNGVAAGGLSLALASDLMLAAESASFHYAYSRIGLSPDGSSTYLLPRLLGTRRTLEFALMGRSLSAREALEWGLVNRVVADPELAETASSLAAELAAGPTESFGAAKRLFHGGWTQTLETQMEMETRTLADTVRTADAREGISAFLQKRPPRFSGR